MKQEENVINRGMVHINDVLPTCLELAGVPYPDSIHGKSTMQPAGKSILPLLYGETESIHDTLYWAHQGGRAIRAGNWKMSALPGEEWELFDISEDMTETRDISKEHPEKVEEMNQAWQTWAKELGIR